MNTVTATFHLSSNSAERLMRTNPLPELRGVHVEENAEEIILTGIVTSYYLKQLAQEALRPVVAGRRMRNRLTVQQS